MDTSSLESKFARIGARAKFVDLTGWAARSARPVTLDVRSDRRGEFFEVRRRPGVVAAVEAIDVRPADRHLLLLVRDGADKSKFLCGHDERHWFVAGVPESAPVGTVRQAFEALKPAEVVAAQAVKALRGPARNRRKNAAFVRQGEWFFVPAAGFAADPRLVLKWEPMRRSTGGKPHWVEELYRTGGEQVYVCPQHPAGLTEAQRRDVLARTPSARGWAWRAMRRNPGVYVRGRVRHADHATITLTGWHRVSMNTENQSKAMASVAFLD